QDVDHFDVEDVTGPRALDEHRPGERVDGARVHRGHAGRGGGGAEVAVAAVAGLEHDLFALVDLEDGRDVRVQAIVPRGGLIAEQLGPVDLDALHGDISLE